MVLSSFGRPRTTGRNFLSRDYVDPLDAEDLQSVADSGITENATDSSAGDSADSTGMSLDMFRERSQGFDVRKTQGEHFEHTYSSCGRLRIRGISETDRSETP